MNHFATACLVACAAAALPAPANAYTTSRDFTLSINVSTPNGTNLSGVAYTLTQDDFQTEYSTSETTLDAKGHSSLRVYGGNHTLRLSVTGLKSYTTSFDVTADKTLDIALTEDIETPYSLTSSLAHDVFTGRNDVTISWNKEQAIFFDDFESYDGWTIDPQPWTGIDVDKYATITLSGSYPNAGKSQYITIANPWTVSPAWDLQYYYTLAPRSGHQYAAFLQNTAGNNNDWFISPKVTLTDDNTLRFFCRTADAVPGRIRVGITTAENPKATDFVTINEGNYISPGYEDWTEVKISLADYAGQTVRIGFNCTSTQGAMMTMIDDFFIGRINPYAQKAERAPLRSPANPNEKFLITLDGQQVAETENYHYTFESIADGHHVAGVQSKVVTGTSEVVTTEFDVNSADYATATLNVAANNGRSVDGMTVLFAGTDASYTTTIASGRAAIASLPKGAYKATIESDGYETSVTEFDLQGDISRDITLNERIVTPFNIVADIRDNGNGTCDVDMSWNRDLGFEDSFESYRDFATINIGDWVTYNFNGEHQPSYPISFNGYIVNFQGASTQENPRSVPPIVFNPKSTRPSLEPDAGFTAPDGDKYIAFMSPQSTNSDKWLISPKVKVYEQYEFSCIGKSYGGYDETIQFLISEGGDQPEDFVLLDEVEMPSDQWTQYTIDLGEYVGKTVRLAIRDVTYDGFVAQIDKVRIAPAEGSILLHGAGFVKSYDVTLDGNAAGNTVEPQYHFAALPSAKGVYTVGVRGNYETGSSEEAQYTLNISSGVNGVTATLNRVTTTQGAIHFDMNEANAYTLLTPAGQTVARGTLAEGTHTLAVPAGIYLLRLGTATLKLLIP